MAVKVPNVSSRYIGQEPFAMATVAGAAHILIYVNSAFCRLSGKSEDELVGKPFHEILGDRPECLALLNRVYCSGKSESFTERDHTAPVFWSYTIWPVVADEPAVGVMIQAVETASLYEQTLAMNEALVIGSLRQLELAAVATFSATQLQTEVVRHKQRELDALMLTNELSHRIKNNLQLVSNLIHLEAKGATAARAAGYVAMQARIGAIAGLYDLISQSASGETVALAAYLGNIAEAMSASLLGTASAITIEVRAGTLDIHPDRAVPFGLLVNELTTNAIKHAFPEGKGSVVLSVRQSGDEIELDVADNGVGMRDKHSAMPSEKHGANYVAIFVRQLGGTLSWPEPEGTGTIVRVRFPLVAVP